MAEGSPDHAVPTRPTRPVAGSLLLAVGVGSQAGRLLGVALVGHRCLPRLGMEESTR